MPPSPEQCERFGEHLLGRRKQAGLSRAELAAALHDRGVTKSDKALGAWERGEYAPDSFEAVDALEQILNIPGELAALLGYQVGEARLSALEASVETLIAEQEAQRQLLRELVARLTDEANGEPQ